MCSMDGAGTEDIIKPLGVVYWIIIDVDDDGQNITGIKIRKNQKNSEMRIETIDW